MTKRGPKPEDLTDQKFGRLTALAHVPTRLHSHWLCRCACGLTLTVRAHRLKSGNTQSCGCLRSEQSADRLRAMWRRIHAGEPVRSPQQPTTASHTTTPTTQAPTTQTPPDAAHDLPSREQLTLPGTH